MNSEKLEKYVLLQQKKIIIIKKIIIFKKMMIFYCWLTLKIMKKIVHKLTDRNLWMIFIRVDY